MISDGQHSVRKAVATVLPDVPHQLCHFHFLREAALPIFEAVHVNRMLQELREAGLIVLKNRKLLIPNLEQLQAYCGFTPNYLHLTPRSDGSATNAMPHG